MYAVFNRPNPVLGPSSDTAISDFLLQAFQVAENGSRVYGSVYHWNDSQFAKDLLSVAKGKGLKLSITAGDTDYEVSDAVADFFAQISSGGIWEHAAYYVNHNKLFIFQSIHLDQIQLGRGVKVIGPIEAGFVSALYVSSANVTRGTAQDDEKQNAGILVPISTPARAELKRRYASIHARYSLVSALSEVLQQLDSDLASGLFARADYRTVRSSRVKLYFFPRQRHRDSRNDIDTIRHVLQNCQHYEGPVAGQTCKIHIVTPRFRDGRIGVANALKRLKDNGATIQIVTRSHADIYNGDPELGQEIEKVLRTCATLHLQNSAGHFIIHSKYMLVEAPYRQRDGSYKWQRLVWVGTPNLTGASLETQWETLAKIYETQESYDAFLEDFHFLVKNATLPPQPPTP